MRLLDYNALTDQFAILNLRMAFSLQTRQLSIQVLRNEVDAADPLDDAMVSNKVGLSLKVDCSLLLFLGAILIG